MEEKKKKLRVLVVEDDETVRTLLSSMAREVGFECKTAANGAEGFKLFPAFNPDLIFSDISMPVMDGLAMLEKIRQVSYEVIVVMLTEPDSTELARKAMELSANDFLLKPITPNLFRSHLQKLADVTASRTAEEEIIGMILHRELTMKVGNLPLLVGKVADRLIREAGNLVPPQDRLGIRLGLVEIILNAIEHGNLGITYEEKTEAQGNDLETWEKLVTQRQTSEPYNTRHVLIQFQLEKDSCQWMIADEGEGFDWTKVPDPTDLENSWCTHGRGIMLSKFSFDEVRYLGKGNQVLLRKRINRPV